MAHGGAVLVAGLVLILIRRLLAVEHTWEIGSFGVGVLLIAIGLTVAYRIGRLEAHDHPHLHGEDRHDHIHLHGASEQTHDHHEGRFSIADRGVSPANLTAVAPALVLAELGAILYLVAYLPVSILSMGGLGFSLGHPRIRRRDPDEIVRFGVGSGYATVVLGIVWVTVWWLI